MIVQKRCNLFGNSSIDHVFTGKPIDHSFFPCPNPIALQNFYRHFYGLQRLIVPYQEHGSHIEWIDKSSPSAPHCDAIVTNEIDTALGIVTADCAPVLLYDPSCGMIAACHAGREPTIQGILPKLLHVMEKKGSTIGTIQAVIGPCIGYHAHTYTLNTTLQKKILQTHPSFEPFFTHDHNDQVCLALPFLIEFILREQGVQSIHIMPHDTFIEETHWFSHRQQLRNPHLLPYRQLSIIINGSLKQSTPSP